MTGVPFHRPLRISLSCSSAFLLLAFLAAPAPATANTPAKGKSNAETSLNRIQRTVAKIDAEAKTPEGEDAVVKRLIRGLRREVLFQGGDVRPDGGLVVIVLAGRPHRDRRQGRAGASRTGKTPDDVVAMRSSGTSWIDIAKDLGVKVDTVAKRMRRHAGPSPRR